jgi:hypothetical protein
MNSHMRKNKACKQSNFIPQGCTKWQTKPKVKKMRKVTIIRVDINKMETKNH